MISREPRVVVADDDALARRVITGTLREAGICVVAEATCGVEAVETVRSHLPDLVLLDILMPGLDGIDAAHRISQISPETRIVLLTGSKDEEAALRGLRAGAVGYLNKDVELDAIPRALRATLAGEAAISRTMAMRLVEGLRHGSGRVRPVRSTLTAREWEVLDLICEGRSNDEIAREFVVSCETVKTHVKNVMRKLDVHSRQDAIAVAATLRESVELGDHRRVDGLGVELVVDQPLEQQPRGQREQAGGERRVAGHRLQQRALFAPDGREPLAHLRSRSRERPELDEHRQ
ncbi:MAG TPA: response regulator transcription factor [Solirubrobacter sp.]|nr:response regulator transcription factor [Solirubrobacter sp.]